MKLLGVVFGLLVFGSNFVRAADSASILFTGAETEKEVKMTTAVYRTEYRTEYYEDTCSREVSDGYEQVCHSVPHESCTGAPPTCRDVCHQGPNGEICRDVCSEGNQSCSTEYSESCSSEPRSHTEYYSCTRSHEVPYEVFDHNVEANVKLVFDKLPEGIEAKEKFNLGLSDSGAVALSVDTSKNLLILADKVVDANNNQGSTVVKFVRYNVSFLDLAKVKKSLMQLSNIKLDLTQLSFVGGSLDSSIDMKYVINLTKKKIFKNQKILAGEIAEKELVVSVNQGIKTLAVKFAQEKIELKKGKFKVEIITSASFGGKSPINASDLNLLGQKSELVLKLK